MTNVQRHGRVALVTGASGGIVRDLAAGIPGHTPRALHSTGHSP
jgi:uncharacterized membrane protein YeiH